MKARQPLSLIIALIMLVSAASSVLAQADDAITPDVRVSPTGVVDGKVLIARAAVTGPSWIVIHADDNGAPGEVIGYAPLEAGENTNIPVEIDPEATTPVMHAMLHDDKGEVGVYEFPGPDTPTKIDDNIVMAAFSATPTPPPTEGMSPDVQVSPEGVVNGEVIIARATTMGPSWVVIHADDNGAPGEVIGYAPLVEGENTDVIVDIDTEAATPTLHAMLHDDNGEVGVYEFPGPDTPTKIDDTIVMAAFSATGTGGPTTEAQSGSMTEDMAAGSAKGATAPVTMPETGGAPATGTVLVVVLSVLAMLGGSAVFLRRSQVSRR